MKITGTREGGSGFGAPIMIIATWEVMDWLINLPEPRWKNAKKAIIETALAMNEGNESKTAAFLGTSRRILHYQSKKGKAKK